MKLLKSTVKEVDIKVKVKSIVAGNFYFCFKIEKKIFKIMAHNLTKERRVMKKIRN